MESPSKLGIKLPFAVLAVFSHSAAFVSDSLKLHGTSVHGDSPGKNTGVGCHALLQGIFPNQGSNPGLPHCRQILYPLSHQGSPDFPLSTALAASFKFWYVVFSFLFVLSYFLISFSVSSLTP